MESAEPFLEELGGGKLFIVKSLPGEGLEKKLGERRDLRSLCKALESEGEAPFEATAPFPSLEF